MYQVNILKGTTFERTSKIAWILAAVTGFLVAGCSIARGEEAIGLNPYEGAPVTAGVDGNTLIVTNNMSNPVYIRVFPTDILPAIEWAPCIAPETCPADQAIERGEEKRYRVKELVREESESITVFWWRYLEKRPGASIPPMELDEIIVPLP